MTDITDKLMKNLQWWHHDCEVRMEAKREIERLRAENERYRIALLGICRPVWSRPPIDSEAANTYAHICQEMITIAQFALDSQAGDEDR